MLWRRWPTGSSMTHSLMWAGPCLSLTFNPFNTTSILVQTLWGHSRPLGQPLDKGLSVVSQFVEETWKLCGAKSWKGSCQPKSWTTSSHNLSQPTLLSREPNIGLTLFPSRLQTNCDWLLIAHREKRLPASSGLGTLKCFTALPQNCGVTVLRWTLLWKFLEKLLPNQGGSLAHWGECSVRSHKVRKCGICERHFDFDTYLWYKLKINLRFVKRAFALTPFCDWPCIATKCKGNQAYSFCAGLEIWQIPFVMAIFVTKGSAFAVVLFVLSKGLGRHKTHPV